jgi:hypothetical protein
MVVEGEKFFHVGLAGKNNRTMKRPKKAAEGKEIASTRDSKHRSEPTNQYLRFKTQGRISLGPSPQSSWRDRDERLDRVERAPETLYASSYIVLHREPPQKTKLD